MFAPQVEPKKFEFQISEGDKEHLELKVNATIPIICSTPHCVVIVNVVQEDESGQAVLSGCQLEFWRSNHPQQKKFNVTAKRDKILDGNRVMHIQLTVNRKKKFTPDEWKKHLPIRKVKVKQTFVVKQGTVLLLSNYMQFGCINEIIYHLIYVLVSMLNFKCGILQKQNQSPFSGKNYEKFFEIFQA